ncbi:hypothetical protein [Polycyclovorans algicola]|uniref:hypothetical protein n=1 Tax=Polycyclovorans algicola TaxID=616992 RepID=UPI0004A75856|nr:hypothetical protein [Polycyclovorans algicola]
MNATYPRAASPVGLHFVEGSNAAEIAEFADVLFAHAAEGLTALSKQLANRQSLGSLDDADLLSTAESITALAAHAVDIAKLANCQAHHLLEEELRAARAGSAPAS